MNKTTFMAKPGQVERKWYVVDATDVPLGRLSAVVLPTDDRLLYIGIRRRPTHIFQTDRYG